MLEIPFVLIAAAVPATLVLAVVGAAGHHPISMWGAGLAVAVAVFGFHRLGK